MATFAAATSALGLMPCIFAATTAGFQVTINSKRSYTAVHMGVTSAGAAASGLVAIGRGAAPTAADYTSEENKLLLPSGASVEIPAQFRGKERNIANTLVFVSASGSPMIQLIPGDTELG